MATLKPQNNGPLYSNTVIGRLAVDGWAVTFDTARRGLGGLQSRTGPSLLYRGVTSFQFFNTKRYGNIPTEIFLAGPKIAIFDQHLAMLSMTDAGPSSINISTAD